jgi:hypothetical protein
VGKTLYERWEGQTEDSKTDQNGRPRKDGEPHGEPHGQQLRETLIAEESKRSQGLQECREGTNLAKIPFPTLAPSRVGFAQTQALYSRQQGAALASGSYALEATGDGTTPRAGSEIGAIYDRCR